MSDASCWDLFCFSSRKEWLEARRKYITASDCYDAIHNPFAVYAKKVSGEDGFEPTARMRFGSKVESAVREMYSENTGREIFYPGPHALAVSTKYPWLACSLDGLIYADGTKRFSGVYEGKANSVFVADKWDGDVPERYKWQGMAALAVTQLNFCGFACLLDMDVHANDMARDDALIEHVAERTKELWDRIEIKDPPPVNGTETTARALKAFYPHDNGATVELNESLADSQYRHLEAIKEEIRSLEEQKLAIENWFRAEIGDATFGVFGGCEVSLKTTVRKAHQVAESKFRALRFKGEK